MKLETIIELVDAIGPFAGWDHYRAIKHTVKNDTGDLYVALMRQLDIEPVKAAVIAAVAASYGIRTLDTTPSLVSAHDHTTDEVLTREQNIEQQCSEIRDEGDWIVFDTETTGLSDDDEIIQLAVINQQGETLLDTLIQPSDITKATRPGKNGRSAADVHGITPEMLKNAPTLEEIAPRIRAVMDGQKWLAFNMAFDSKMLAQTFALNGMKDARPQSSNWQCLMDLFSEWVGDWNDYHGNYRWQRLSTAVSTFDLQVDGDAHNALHDARVTLALLNALADRWDAREAPQEVANVSDIPF